ncbi:MAG: hypothetical protein AAGN15_21355 [Cyanobacteria bacterium J06581_3]
MNNSITTATAQKTEKAGACFVWIQQSADNSMQRPTVSLVMENIEAALK